MVSSKLGFENGLYNFQKGKLLDESCKFGMKSILSTSHIHKAIFICKCNAFKYQGIK